VFGIAGGGRLERAGVNVVGSSLDVYESGIVTSGMSMSIAAKV
jgi:hypothetical protein